MYWNGFPIRLGLVVEDVMSLLSLHTCMPGSHSIHAYTWMKPCTYMDEAMHMHIYYIYSVITLQETTVMLSV